MAETLALVHPEVPASTLTPPGLEVEGVPWEPALPSPSPSLGAT